jgi:hypothetical protein
MTMILNEYLTSNQAAMVAEASPSPSGEGKDWYLKGIFIQGGVRNLNRRVYPVSEIRNAVNSVNEILSSGQSILGECDHPQELTINLDRVSHMITEMKMEGNAGMGKMKIIGTPMGQLIRTLIEAGAKLGVSSRGSGNVDYDGSVSEFEIITVDIVAKPSAPDAYPTAVYEAFNGKRGSVIDDLARAVANDPKAQKHLNMELLTWVNQLK